MAYKKGETGNPNGRPPKSRALTEILRKAGAKTVNADGLRLSSRRLLARLLWDGITTGTVKFPDGTKFELGAGDWLAMVQFLYKHIDGPPPAALDVNMDKITIRIVDESAAKDE